MVLYSAWWWLYIVDVSSWLLLIDKVVFGLWVYILHLFKHSGDALPENIRNNRVVAGFANVLRLAPYLQDWVCTDFLWH